MVEGADRDELEGQDLLVEGFPSETREFSTYNVALGSIPLGSVLTFQYPGEEGESHSVSGSLVL